ncbi:MAG: hypothetical protein OEW19_00870 [Acidobacteriota bacterium]|nr:hypothetical protein [Acidobacteriota bacterium]
MRFLDYCRRLSIGVACAGALAPGVAEGGQSLAGGSLSWTMPETMRPASAVGLSVYGGAGDSAGVDAAPVDPLLGGPFYTGFIGGLSHRRRGPTYVFSATAGSSYRYFPESRELLNLESAGVVSLENQVSQHGRLRLSQAAQHTRFRQIGIVPGDSADPGTPGDLPTANPEGSATVGQPFYALTSAVNFSQSFGPRSSLLLDYSYQTSLNTEWVVRPETHEARIRYERRAGRRASVWLGAQYRMGMTGLVADVPDIRANNFEGGLEYTRRGTTIGASSGIVLASRGGVLGTSGDGLGRQIVAGLAVGQALGQSWRVRADYNRRLQFVQALPDPFVADEANGMVDGQLGRRANVTARVGYVTGVATVTTASPDQRIEGWRASAGFGIVLSRRLRAHAQYNYTQNRFSQGALDSLPPNVLPRSNWGGVQAGLSVWAPFVH